VGGKSPPADNRYAAGYDQSFVWHNLPNQLREHARLLAYKLEPGLNPLSHALRPTELRQTLLELPSTYSTVPLYENLIGTVEGFSGSLYRSILYFNETASRLNFAATELNKIIQQISSIGSVDPIAAATRLQSLGKEIAFQLENRLERCPNLPPSVASGLIAGLTGGTLLTNLVAISDWTFTALYTAVLTISSAIYQQEQKRQVLKKRNACLDDLAKAYNQELACTILYYLQPLVYRLNYLFNQANGYLARMQTLETAIKACVDSSPPVASKPIFAIGKPIGALDLNDPNPNAEDSISLSITVFPGDTCNNLKSGSLIYSPLVLNTLTSFMRECVFETPSIETPAQLSTELLARYKPTLLEFARPGLSGSQLQKLLESDLENYLEAYDPDLRLQTLQSLGSLAW
jgi:hypothetical protein